MPVGFRVFRRSSRPDAALLQRFAELHTADLSDAMNRSGTMDRGIQPVFTPIKRVVGPAVTVSAPTGAFNMVKIGMEQTRAGDVLVINARGVLNGALVGGNVCRGLVHRGLAGFVADGAVRDASEIREDGLPTFARGVTTVMGPIDGPGEVNVPIACGGWSSTPATSSSPTRTASSWSAPLKRRRSSPRQRGSRQATRPCNRSSCVAR